MEENQNQDQKISKYSSGVNILKRLDYLWRKTHLYIENGIYLRWNTVLDVIWLELARDIKKIKEDKDENKFEAIETKFNEFEEKLETFMPFSDDKPSGFKDPSPEDIKKRNEVYKLLKQKQLFLARLENTLGKGTTYDEEDDDDFD